MGPVPSGKSFARKDITFKVHFPGQTTSRHTNALCQEPPTASCAWRKRQGEHRQLLERRSLAGDLIKTMMGTVLAYITFGGSMFGAVYLLLHDKPIESLAALVTALGAAFGPKIYLDFFEPKPQPPAVN